MRSLSNVHIGSSPFSDFQYTFTVFNNSSSSRLVCIQRTRYTTVTLSATNPAAEAGTLSSKQNSKVSVLISSHQYIYQVTNYLYFHLAASKHLGFVCLVIPIKPQAGESENMWQNPNTFNQIKKG